VGAPYQGVSLFWYVEAERKVSRILRSKKGVLLLGNRGEIKAFPKGIVSIVIARRAVVFAQPKSPSLWLVRVRGRGKEREGHFLLRKKLTSFEGNLGVTRKKKGGTGRTGKGYACGTGGGKEEGVSKKRGEKKGGTSREEF